MDEAGVRQAEEDERRVKSGRYQCGPFSVDANFNNPQETQPFSDGSSFLNPSSQGLKVRSRAKGQRMIAGCFPADAVEGDEEDPAPAAQAKRDYEARVNPFAEFQRNEADQRLMKMPAHERALLATSRAIVGSKFARALTAVYLVLMHLFVIVLLFFALSPGVECGGHSEGSLLKDPKGP